MIASSLIRIRNAFRRRTSRAIRTAIASPQRSVLERFESRTFLSCAGPAPCVTVTFGSGTETVDVVIPDQSTDWNYSSPFAPTDVPQFNPANGTLNSVVVTQSASMTNNTKIENSSKTATNSATFTFNGSVKLTVPNSGTGVTLPVTVSAGP